MTARSSVFLVGATIFLFPQSVYAWNPFYTEHRGVKKGNRLVAQGKVQDALKKYAAALGDLPGNAAIYYNQGVAYYKLAQQDEGARQENLARAAQALLGAIDLAEEGNNNLKGKSFYNLGNVYFLSERWQEAAEAYRQALKLMPGDKNAAFNLALALKKIEEEKKRQEAKEKEQKEKGKEEEQKQKQQEQGQEQQQQQQQQQNQTKPPEEEQKDQCQDPQQGQGEQEKGQQEDQKEPSQQQKKDTEEKSQGKTASPKEEAAEQKQQQPQPQDAEGGEKGEGEEREAPAIPLTRQQAEAILDALERGEKNFLLETLKSRGKGKARVLKDW